MNKIFLIIPIAIVFVCLLQSDKPDEKKIPVVASDKNGPTDIDDYFFIQRTYPDERFALMAYDHAIKQALSEWKQASGSRAGAAWNWTLEGPTNIGGRINCLAVDPADQNIIYAGSASGGVFKTVDGGNNWNPIFDDQPYLSIGSITIDPNNSDRIFVGTGDVNISGYPFIGDGIYKSENGGTTWTHLGLEDQRIIAKIAIDPNNSDIIYTATMGIPFERNNDRGLYKSSDGGTSWNQILFLSDEAGTVDVLIDPANSQRIFAAGWDRIRNNHESLISGNHGRIYRSENGGASWDTLYNGLPNERICRTGLAVSGDSFFCIMVDSFYNLKGIYVSEDEGDSWDSISLSTFSDNQGGFGWYFGQLDVNPFNPQEMYVCGVELWGTTDGGQNWFKATPAWWLYDVHADDHDVFFLDAENILLATDGGIYKRDAFQNWSDIENIPNSQFYEVAVNPNLSGTYYGGLQDNGTTAGNSSILNAWPRIYGGDGFQPAFRADNPDIMFTETQNGGLVVSDDGGNNFYDAMSGVDFNNRINWNMPYIISNHNQDVMYLGTDRVYQSIAGYFPSWNALSDDLTHGNIFGSRFHTVSCVEESPVNENILWAGTTDANVWVTSNQGLTWDSVHMNLPHRYVTDIACSFLNQDITFVSISGYKDNDFIPHIHMTVDRGQSWIDISGDLPPLAVNDIELTSMSDSLIFVATDGGVYFTANQGTNWFRLGDNMPIMTVYDLAFDGLNNKIIAGTFARSMWSIEVDSLIDLLNPQISVSDDDTICSGNSVSVSASGGSIYSWLPASGLSCSSCANTIASPTSTTNYTVTISDANGVIGVDSVLITVNPSPAQPIITSSNDTLFCSLSAAEYLWFLDGSWLTGFDTQFIVTDVPGNYAVEVVNEFGCSNISDEFSFNPFFVQTINLDLVSVYPNPVTDYLRFNFFVNLPVEAFIYNSNGELLKNFKFHNGMIDVRKLESGIYYLKIISGNNSVIRKFVKF